MTGSINSRSLGKSTINSGRNLVPVVCFFNVQNTRASDASIRNSATANLSFDFDIDGGSGRHGARADLKLGFNHAVAASRLKAMRPNIISLPFHLSGDPTQRVVVGADMTVDLMIEDKMQFAHLRRAPHGRVMIVEAEVRSSTLPREGN